MMTWLRSKSILILLTTLAMSGIGFLAHKATSKESVQQITVGQGGTAIIQQSTEKDNSDISLSVGGGYTSKDNWLIGAWVTKKF